jgi:beta-glucosidase/6-phospho-beta-glucosidase/beta-galactosidase
VRAAEIATRTYNERFLDVMLTGRYSDAYLQAAGPAAPNFTDADLRAIGSPLDFVGVNIYIPKSYIDTHKWTLVSSHASRSRATKPTIGQTRWLAR